MLLRLSLSAHDEAGRALGGRQEGGKEEWKESGVSTACSILAIVSGYEAPFPTPSLPPSYLSIHVKEGQFDLRLACHIADVQLVHACPIRLSLHATLIAFLLSVLTGRRVFFPLAAATAAAAGGGGGDDGGGGRRCCADSSNGGGGKRGKRSTWEMTGGRHVEGTCCSSKEQEQQQW